jgi:hypothetical protein
MTFLKGPSRIYLQESQMGDPSQWMDLILAHHFLDELPGEEQITLF